MRATSLVPFVFAFVCSTCLQKTTILVRVLNFFLRIKYLIRGSILFRTFTLSATRTIQAALCETLPLTSPRNYEPTLPHMQIRSRMSDVIRNLFRCLFEDGTTNPSFRAQLIELDIKRKYKEKYDLLSKS